MLAVSRRKVSSLGITPPRCAASKMASSRKMRGAAAPVQIAGKWWRNILAGELGLLSAREAPALRGETPGPALV